MNSGMRIELKWLPPFQGTEEVRRTSAEIKILFGSENATYLDDGWSSRSSMAHESQPTHWPSG